jgi:hypothetical protein
MKAVAIFARTLRRLAARLAARIRAGKAERDARKEMGMPVRHPERLTRELPEVDEEWLAALAAELWPGDEYTQIITETRREDR